MSYQEILPLLKVGEFQLAIPQVKKYLKENNFNRSFRIFKALSSVLWSLTEELKGALEEEAILELSKLCFQAFKNEISLGDCLIKDGNILKCFCHIANWFYAKKKFKSVISFVEAGLATVEELSDTLQDDERKRLGSLQKLICQAIYGITSGCDKVESTTVKPMWKVLFSVSKFSEDTRCFQYALNDVVAKCKDFQECSPFYLKELEKFCRKYSVKNYRLFSTVATTFLLHCIKNKGFKDAKDIIKELSKCVSICFRVDSEEMKTWKWAEMVINTFLSVPTSSSDKLEEQIGHFLEFLNTQKYTEKFDSPVSCTFYMIGKVTSSLCEYWLENAQETKKMFSLPVMMLLQKFSMNLCKVLELSQCHTCTHSGKPCQLKEDLIAAFEVILNTSKLAKIVLTETCDGDSLLEDILFGFQKCQKYGKDAVVCAKSVHLRTNLSFEIYGIGVHCVNLKKLRIARDFFSLALECFMETCDVMIENDFSRILLAILSQLYNSEYKLGLKDKAPAKILVPFVARWPKDRKVIPNSYMSWLWTLCQEEKFQESGTVMTASEFISQNRFHLQSLCRPLPTNQIDQIDYSLLLLWELECYSIHRFRCTAVVSALCDSIESTISSPLNVLRAIALGLRAVTKTQDIKGVQIVRENFSHLNYEKIVKDIAESQLPAATCSLAQIKFWQFVFRFRLHVENCEEFSEKALKNCKVQGAVFSPEDVLDPNDTSVVDVSNNVFVVSYEEKRIEELSSVVKLVEESLNQGLSPTSFETDEEKTLFCNDVLALAFFFDLHSYNERAASAWKLCVEVGKRLEMPDLVILGVSGVLKLEQTSQDLISAAETVISANENSVSKHILEFYFACHALHSLRNGDFLRGSTYLCKVSFTITSSDNAWSYSFCNLVKAMYSVLPSDIDLDYEFHFEAADISAITGFTNSLNALNKSEKWRNVHSYFAFGWQVMETSFWLGQFYIQTKQPSEGRMYLKKGLETARQGGLCVRLAQFMTSLADLDVLTEKFEDAKIKYEDVTSILQRKKEKTTSQELDDLAKETATLRIGGASPNLSSARYVLPEFIQHDSSCDCVSCSNISIELIYIALYLINAQIARKALGIKCADREFRDGIKLARAVSAKQSRKLSHHDHHVLYYEARLYLAYSNMLFFHKIDNLALKYLNYAESCVGNMKTPDVSMESDILELLVVIADEKEKEDLSGKNEKKPAEEISEPSSSNIHTPCNVVLKKPAMVPPKKHIFLPPVGVPKCIVYEPEGSDVPNDEEPSDHAIPTPVVITKKLKTCGKATSSRVPKSKTSNYLQVPGATSPINAVKHLIFNDDDDEPSDSKNSNDPDSESKAAVSDDVKLPKRTTRSARKNEPIVEESGNLKKAASTSSHQVKKISASSRAQAKPSKSRTQK